MTAQTTEEKILAAAEKEFTKKGFDAARTISIAREAGVTHAMLHYYFRSKENLYKIVFSGKLSMIGELMLESITNSTLPVLERIRMAISRHFDLISANPELPRFLIREVYSRPDSIAHMAAALRAAADKTIAGLQRGIDEAASRGECRRVNAGMLMLDIVSLNVFSFLAQPIVEAVMPELLSRKERFLEERKKDNIETIMRKLKV